MALAGHAGLFSNVPDLLRLRRRNPAQRINQPTPRTKPLPVRLGRIETICSATTARGQFRALGWDTPSQPSSSGKHFARNSIGHLGYSGCSLWIDLDAAVAVVLLTNRTWPDRQIQLIREVRPLFHDAVRESL